MNLMHFLPRIQNFFSQSSFPFNIHFNEIRITLEIHQPKVYLTDHHWWAIPLPVYWCLRSRVYRYIWMCVCVVHHHCSIASLCSNVIQFWHFLSLDWTAEEEEEKIEYYNFHWFHSLDFVCCYFFVPVFVSYQIRFEDFYLTIFFIFLGPTKKKKYTTILEINQNCLSILL